MPRGTPTRRPGAASRHTARRRTALRTAALLLALVCADGVAPRTALAQLSRQDYERGRKMLEQLRKNLREHYYDTTFNGVNLDAELERADAGLRAARDRNHMMAIIAEYLAKLDDSHTWFYPPSHVAEVDYGFGMQYVGDTCFVVRVRKGSDAEKKGLEVGDAVLAIDRFTPTRQNFRTIQYIYNALSPRPGMRLVVRSPDGAQREVVALAKITEGARVVDYNDLSTFSRFLADAEDASRRPDHYYRSLGDSVLIWRMPSFVIETPGIDDMMRIARKHRAVILDLRNNGGGYVSTELHLVGQFFDRDVHVFSYRTRKGLEPKIAKPVQKEPYRGMLVILVNGRSASASEITARIMQLEGRAIVVGDRTAGAVVTSVSFSHEVGFGKVYPYGTSISVADVIMPDGTRLERVGVTPDHLVLPTGADLAAGRDPAMAKALQLVGVTMDADAAARVIRSMEK